MRRYVVALALFSAAVLASSTLTAEEPKKEEKKKDEKTARKEFSKLMKDTHRGDKSPHARIVAELKKDTPDWAEIAKDTKTFTDMGAAFKGVRLDYVSPAGYIKSAAELAKATGEKDKKAATEAFLGLTKTCIACHSYGGPANALSFDSDRRLK
jgi:hypothetical protein